MLFTSPVFMFLFLPVSVLVYNLLARKQFHTTRKLWLVCASLFFYGWWNPYYLLLLIISILVNYTIAKIIRKVSSVERGKVVLFLGVAFNIALLLYYKYAYFIVSVFSELSGTNNSIAEIVLPLAISFFTFQQIAYLNDCLKETVKDYSLLDYFLFVTFFPQLIAGPIVHHKEMLPQFLSSKISNEYGSNFEKGLFIFSIGLVKKLVIADTLAYWANMGFDKEAALPFLDSWITSLSYSLQLYYDFSAYSDMAIGIGLMMNIRLPVNFFSPYKSRNIQEFWRCWHMTLSRWLKHYVYFPLGGNRHGVVLTFAALFLTFLLGGAWHGAGWTFLIWGALHGVAAILFRVWKMLNLTMPRALAWFLTLQFVNATWVMFRANDVESAKQILKGMIGLNGFSMPIDLINFSPAHIASKLPTMAGTGQEYVIDSASLIFVMFFGTIALVSKNSIELSLYNFSTERLISTKTGMLTGFLLSVALLASLGNTEMSEFLYFNF